MENQETVTMEVIVHKANISLQSGESVQEFSNLLRLAAKSHVMQQLNIADDKGGAWMVEVYSDKAVLEVWQEGKNPRYTYQMVGYARDKDGKFSFNSMTEVKRVTTFKPTESSISIAKSEDAETQIWEPTEKAEGVPVNKSIFSDVV